MKIAFFECKEEERSFFEKALSGEELFFFNETINEVLHPKNALHVSFDYDVISVFVHSKIDEALLQKLPNLKYIQTRSTGYNHLLCKDIYKNGLLLSNVSGYAGPAVAEFSFSLLLNATRKTDVALQRAKEGDFHYDDLKGIELFGKKLGVLGLGTIGIQMVRIGKGFGMDVHVYSRSHKPIIDELGLDFVSLDTILKDSDIIMLALPLTPDTTSLINQNNASLIKKDAIIVNAARAELIENSLYEALENSICLDGDNPLHVKENLLFTPHMAYYTKEALGRIMAISLLNIEAFLQNRALPNCLYLECKRNYKEQ